MIKDLDVSKVDNVMKIWFETNISAHDFISRDYWKENYDLVKMMLPKAKVFVYEDKGEIKGFIGTMNGNYIAGLFVVEKCQSTGIGSKLIEKCKEIYPSLTLDVYVKNSKAVKFYERHGFKVVQRKENDETKEKEYIMKWNTIQN